MITVDIHTHTCHSHAADTVADMAEAARARGMQVYGFSEHSPRPEGYDYPVEYRDKLRHGFPDYLREVSALRRAYLDAPEERKPMRVLLGLEVDWIGGERDFIKNMIDAHPYDYLIGSVHFLGHWGFDADAGDWDGLTDEACFAHYEAFFKAEREMAESGWMQVAAHPDLVKIFSIDRFRRWMRDAAHLDLVRSFLEAAKTSGMAMEVSAAGLRKPCREIYPCPEMMRMARELELPISFASDAHSTGQLGWSFDVLEDYARRYGYDRSRFFAGKQPEDRVFLCDR